VKCEVSLMVKFSARLFSLQRHIYALMKIDIMQ
jgi:hypothetical protein